MTLRCPECERIREGVFSQDDRRRLRRGLDAGTDALAPTTASLMRANMAEEIDRFAAALAADAILPKTSRRSARTTPSATRSSASRRSRRQLEVR